MGILAPNNIMLEGFGWYSGWGCCIQSLGKYFHEREFFSKAWGGGGRYCAISEGFF